MDDKSKNRSLTIAGIVSAGTLPFVYCLSIGPVIWLQAHGVIRPEVTRIIFAPLLWICDHVAPLNDLANRYIDIWRYFA